MHMLCSDLCNCYQFPSPRNSFHRLLPLPAQCPFILTKKTPEYYMILRAQSYLSWLFYLYYNRSWWWCRGIMYKKNFWPLILKLCTDEFTLLYYFALFCPFLCLDWINFAVLTWLFLVIITKIPQTKILSGNCKLSC